MDTDDLRLRIYRSFADTGRAPTRAELRARYADADSLVEVLAATRHIVLGDDGEIVMAHPFAGVPLGFAVMGRNTLWWGGCAWDAFALPHLLPGDPEVLVATTCPGCSSALAWNANRDAPPVGDEVAHFLVPVARMWDDVVHTCRNQRLFCSRSCVDAWLAASGNHLGYVMDLTTLWRLAEHWYDGRLDSGYVRREPAESADYLSGVGLTGEFWGG